MFEAPMEGRGDEGQDTCPLAGFQVVHLMGDFFRSFAEEGALIHPEHVAGGEDDAGGGEDGPPDVDLGRALEDEVFADEAV